MGPEERNTTHSRRWQATGEQCGTRPRAITATQLARHRHCTMRHHRCQTSSTAANDVTASSWHKANQHKCTCQHTEYSQCKCLEGASAAFQAHLAMRLCIAASQRPIQAAPGLTPSLAQAQSMLDSSCRYSTHMRRMQVQHAYMQVQHRCT